MQPLATLLQIDKSNRQPVYLQIADQLMKLIREGALPAGHRLLSTRALAISLNVHRKTIVQAYEELLAQGWLESHVGNGTFVARHLPEIHPQHLLKGIPPPDNPVKKAGFSFPAHPHPGMQMGKPVTRYHLDEGFPDPRHAPLKELSRAYRSQLLTGNHYARLGYGDPKGSPWLRQEMSSYLNETRGLKITPENILIVRGTTMGIHLVSKAFLQTGDRAVVSETNWAGANLNFIQAGAVLLKLPADDHGMEIDRLEELCRKHPIRMVYVTSHHHYPTTVALRADRRIQLLRLSEKYGFIIFEDDYDYDFHYLSKPHLPLASADRTGRVIYGGSFTKTISPSFRVGYLVGSENVIDHLAQLRRIIDRQGDTMLENAMAELLKNGILQRHLRKSLRIYRQRRDTCCELLKNLLGDRVRFQVPDGGMAVWTHFDPAIDLEILAQNALRKDLYFYDGKGYFPAAKTQNATRLGFASSTPEELGQCIGILADLIHTGAY